MKWHLRCLLLGHLWYVTKTIVDPKNRSGVIFCNYVNVFYNFECIECGFEKSVQKTIKTYDYIPSVQGDHAQRISNGTWAP